MGALEAFLSHTDLAIHAIEILYGSGRLRAASWLVQASPVSGLGAWGQARGQALSLGQGRLGFGMGPEIAHSGAQIFAFTMLLCA